MSKKIFTLCSLVLLLSASAVARADSFYFSTMPGASVGGGNVAAGAEITTGAGTITITLHDFEADPANVGQILSGFQFTLSNCNSACYTSGTLATSTGTEVTINSNKTATMGGSASTGWKLFDEGGTTGFDLDVLNTPTAPEHLIIGPGPYTNANPSVTGGPHNPFFYESATFVLDVTGVATTTKILTTQFSFGTAAGSSVHGMLTPEPSSLVLLGTGIIGAAVLMRRRISPVRA